MRLSLTLLLALVGIAQTRQDTPTLITSDIANFWKAYDAGLSGDRTVAFQKLYFDPGSPGLKAFINARIKTAGGLADAVDKHPKFYSTIRANTLEVEKQRPAILKALTRYRELLPEAKFPAIYFVIGKLTSGGTTDKEGLLIGTEVSALGPGVDTSEITPSYRRGMHNIDQISLIVVHEFTHMQVDVTPQMMEQMPVIGLLLATSLGEGAADFMTELVTGSSINANMRDWAEARHDELFARFKKDRDGNPNATGRWLYDYTQNDGEPADLGYWIGFEICRDYYNKAADKKAAIREIATMQHGLDVIRGTRYAYLLDKPATPRP